MVKTMNMKVDLLFPQASVSTTKILDDLKKQGCLYALFVAGENEILRTVTVHILYDIYKGKLLKCTQLELLFYQ